MFRLYVCLGCMFYLFSCYNSLLMLWLGLGSKPTWLVLENTMMITWRWFKMSPQTWTAVRCLAASFIISPPPLLIIIMRMWSDTFGTSVNLGRICGLQNPQFSHCILETELNTDTMKLCSIFHYINCNQWVYLRALLSGWPPSVNTFSLKTLKSP